MCKRFLLLMTLVLAALCAGQAQGLRAGAAKVDANAAFGPVQTGKYDHEHLYVRAIVLDNGVTRAALVSVEAGGNGNFDETVKAIQQELDCPAGNIIISTTHTHSGAAMNPTPAPAAGAAPAGPPKPPSGPALKVVEAVRLAKANLQPARIGFGTGSSYLNVNRDAIDPETRKWTQYSDLTAPSDKTVAVLTLSKPTGEPIAVYVNYAMHGINGWVAGIVSGDFMGAMSRYVEKAFGDKIVVAFTQAASGNQNPLYLRPSNNVMLSRDGESIPGFETNREKAEVNLRNYLMGFDRTLPVPKDADPQVMDTMLRFIESEGQVLGEEVIRVMTFTKRMTGEVRIEGLQKELVCPGRKKTNGSKMLREGYEGVYVDGPDRVFHIGVLGIGSTALAWINSEIYTQIGLETKEAAPLKNTMFVTIANGAGSGYTPDDASFGHQTFQVLESPLKPGCAETGIVSAVADLEDQYLRALSK